MTRRPADFLRIRSLSALSTPALAAPLTRETRS
jgi:hypothetical protein